MLVIRHVLPQVARRDRPAIRAQFVPRRQEKDWRIELGVTRQLLDATTEENADRRGSLGLSGTNKRPSLLRDPSERA